MAEPARSGSRASSIAARNTLAGSCNAVSLEITTFDTTKLACERVVGQVLQDVALARAEAAAEQQPPAGGRLATSAASPSSEER